MRLANPRFCQGLIARGLQLAGCGNVASLTGVQSTPANVVSPLSLFLQRRYGVVVLVNGTKERGREE